ncbi:hypothetical protein PMAYCL1PPCAC_21093, partial [Pristionchus mayeri]
VYGICAVITLILTVVALALDAWAKVADGAADAGLLCDVKDLVLMQERLGKGEPPCPFDFSKFGEMDTKVKAILICLILAVIMEVVCIAYKSLLGFRVL